MSMFTAPVPFNTMQDFNYMNYPYQLYQGQNYCPEYNKSDTNSDESINDKDKQSPKYREKRAKNNEAAKKSRLNRKQREKDLQEENQRLKVQINEQAKIIETLKMQLNGATSSSTVVNNGVGYRNEYYTDHNMIPNCDDARMSLRDTTNQQNPPIPTDHMPTHFVEAPDKRLRFGEL